jgi:hypothetical protein
MYMQCILSLLFYVSLHTAVLHVHCHLFFMFYYTELYFMGIVTPFLIFHYTELYFMYIVTSASYFTTQSCTSCTLSPLFYASLHRAVLHVHCHLFYIFVKHKKEVKMYMKDSSAMKHKKEVKMYMKYSCV